MSHEPRAHRIIAGGAARRSTQVLQAPNLRVP